MNATANLSVRMIVGTAVALVLGAVSSGLASGTIAVAVAMTAGSDASPMTYLMIVMGWGVMFMAGGGTAAFLAGTALYVVLRLIRQTAVWPYLVLGSAAFGIAPMIATPLARSLPAESYPEGSLFSGSPVFYIVLAISGAMGGLVFWLIRRPDRDDARGIAP